LYGLSVSLYSHRQILYIQLYITVIACLHRRHRQDKTKLSCLVCVGGVNTTADKTRQFTISKFSVTLNIFETKQLQSVNWVETRQNCLVLSPILFTPPTQTRQFCLVRVGGVNKLLENSQTTTL